jgi:hypothetical protein
MDIKFYHNFAQMTVGANASATLTIAATAFRYNLDGLGTAPPAAQSAQISVVLGKEDGNTQQILFQGGGLSGGAGGAGRIEMYGPGISAVTISTPTFMHAKADLWY